MRVQFEQLEIAGREALEIEGHAVHEQFQPAPTLPRRRIDTDHEFTRSRSKLADRRGARPCALIEQERQYRSKTEYFLCSERTVLYLS